MDEMLSNYLELTCTRYLYERYAQNEDVETNPFNVATINILPDNFSHNNVQCKVFP